MLSAVSVVTMFARVSSDIGYVSLLLLPTGTGRTVPPFSFLPLFFCPTLAARREPQYSVRCCATKPARQQKQVPSCTSNDTSLATSLSPLSKVALPTIFFCAFYYSLCYRTKQIYAKILPTFPTYWWHNNSCHSVCAQAFTQHRVSPSWLLLRFAI